MAELETFNATTLAEHPGSIFMIYGNNPSHFCDFSIIFCRYRYENDLIDHIIIPFFGDIPHENDDIVRKAVIEFLLRFSLQCNNVCMESLLNILEKVSDAIEFIANLIPIKIFTIFNSCILKVVQTPFDDPKIAERCQRDRSDIQITLKGLIDIFVISIYQLPSSNAIKILSILVTFLQRHYDKPQIFESVIEIRLMVRKMFYNFR